MYFCLMLFVLRFDCSVPAHSLGNPKTAAHVAVKFHQPDICLKFSSSVIYNMTISDPVHKLLILHCIG